MSDKLLKSVFCPTDTSMGQNGILYALVRLNNQLQPREKQATQNGLADRSVSDLSLCASFLRDNITNEAYDTGQHEVAARQVELTSQSKKRFIALMLRVARGHEGVSRQEREFVRQFWRALLQHGYEQLLADRQ